MALAQLSPTKHKGVPTYVRPPASSAPLPASLPESHLWPLDPCWGIILIFEHQGHLPQSSMGTIK